MPIQKLSAQNNGWTKKKLRYSMISQICITLAGLESAIVVKGHLVDNMDNCSSISINHSDINFISKEITRM